MYILRIDCPDEKGLVHKVSGVLYHHELNLIRNDEFVDRTHGHFYMRTEFSGECQEEKIMNALGGILPDSVTISLNTNRPKDVVILATKEHHCLSDLLIRNAYKDLNFNILAVVANHDVLRPLVEKFNLPFHLISHEGLSREEHEAAVLSVLGTYPADYVILAKYMRILSPEFQQHFANRMVNIHHSFLPAFVGANPYRQAFERGVKIIGATAHFVNEHLDEGPIITQEVIPVNHTKTWQELAAAGRDVEKMALAKALKLVFEDRVFVKNNKTVVFE
ncbi:formyltetrahydrofolate deformylase [Siphonobacter sp. SORGH_AS_0500]|uniref:formyltetrahydrofolate deformylase n=1 Tax=Siphonobacter sp. SORGH_AS_0500 TaxID=1864824 RepID=UPI000CB26DEA|nr:formyltetrahydrofolate deformylase [Siphonobacter sp. SORGH_AS_0500]PKK37066.1 formyltetrahydrofolate deformylase [Siphonobacter sp. SORGH_AS_0500]